jgi:flagellar biosynthesis chaperone FliJ
MRKKWIHSLLHARQAQEDIAQQRRTSAELAARRARATLRYEADRLSVMGEDLQHRTVTAFLASSAALHAAAATHAAAERQAEQATATAEQRRAELRAAARARRTVEQLHERHLAEERAAALAAEQRELDEIAARRRPAPGEKQ